MIHLGSDHVCELPTVGDTIVPISDAILAGEGEDAKTCADDINNGVDVTQVAGECSAPITCPCDFSFRQSVAPFVFPGNCITMDFTNFIANASNSSVNFFYRLSVNLIQANSCNRDYQGFPPPDETFFFTGGQEEEEATACMNDIIDVMALYGAPCL